MKCSLALVALALVQLASAGKLRSSEGSLQLVQAEPGKKAVKKGDKLENRSEDEENSNSGDDKVEADKKEEKAEENVPTKKAPKAWEPQYKPAAWKSWFGGSDKTSGEEDVGKDDYDASDEKKKDIKKGGMKGKEERDDDTSDELENSTSTKKEEGKTGGKEVAGKKTDKKETDNTGDKNKKNEKGKQVEKKVSNDKDSDEAESDTKSRKNKGKNSEKVEKPADEDEEKTVDEGKTEEETEEDNKLERRRRREQAIAKAKAKESHDVPYNSWGEFLPACRKELKDLVTFNEYQYGPPQLKGVLEHECDLDKQFPTVRERFFDRRKECKVFAQQLVQARAAERNGKVNAYDECCTRWWDEYMSKDHSHHGNAFFWLYVCFTILVVVLVGATVMKHMA